MSTLYSIEYKKKKTTEKNAKAIADELINIWCEKPDLVRELYTNVINKYKNTASLFLLVLQVLDEDLNEREINATCMGLYEFILTMLVNQFITEWIDYCNWKQSILVNQFITERIDNDNIQPTESYFDMEYVPFLIWFLECERDDEYPLDQGKAFYDFKYDFCKMLNKKLKEDPVIDITVEYLKYAENSLLYNMAKEIAIRERMFLDSGIIIYRTNDNLNRTAYDPNIIVHNLSMYYWFCKMFARAQAQQESSHTVKTGSKLNSSILYSIPIVIIYQIKLWIM